MASTDEPRRPSTALSASAAAFSPIPTPANAEHDGLSGAAPVFSPAAQDNFAQTEAQQDDLFSDGFVPAEESLQTRAEDSLFDDDFVPAEPEPEPVIERQAPTSSRGRGGPPRGPRGRAGFANQPQSQARLTQQLQQPSSTSAGQQSQSTGIEASIHAPAGPAQLQNQPAPRTTPAVRGDRRATGGPQRAKLTEDQLAEKMAAARIRSEKATAAHEKAEADRHAHAEREVQAEQRRKEDRQNRQQMMGEREKNRLRKLKAQTGREWDAEKVEEARGKDRGIGGDKADYSDGREYIYKEGRGGGGRGGGRGAPGRGGRGGGGQAKPQTAPTKDDFPALPAAAQKAEGKDASTSAGAESTGLSNGAIASWADQVESAAPS